MNYTWEIIEVGRRDVTNDDGETLTDAVVYVDWQKTATDTDSTVARSVGRTTLDLSGTAAADFVAYADVTQAQLVTWIEAALGDAKVATLNNKLAEKLNRKRTTFSEFSG